MFKDIRKNGIPAAPIVYPVNWGFDRLRSGTLTERKKTTRRRPQNNTQTPTLICHASASRSPEDHKEKKLKLGRQKTTEISCIGQRVNKAVPEVFSLCFFEQTFALCSRNPRPRWSWFGSRGVHQISTWNFYMLVPCSKRFRVTVFVVDLLELFATLHRGWFTLARHGCTWTWMKLHHAFGIFWPSLDWEPCFDMLVGMLRRQSARRFWSQSGTSPKDEP